MTKYVVQSGGAKRYPLKLAKFIAESSKGMTGTTKVLLCFFAGSEDSWETKYREWQVIFNEYAPADVEFSFELAKLKDFANQVAECDILYMHGGNVVAFLERINKFDVPKIWEGKTVVTNSASSHGLSISFQAADYRKLFDGLGVLPFKCIAHYKSTIYDADEGGPIDWEKTYKELESYGDKSVPIHALEEGDFIVIEQ